MIASVLALRFPWLSMTAFGWRVVPEVYWIDASWSASQPEADSTTRPFPSKARYADHEGDPKRGMSIV